MPTGWVPAPLALCVPVVVNGVTRRYQLSGDFCYPGRLIEGGLFNVHRRLLCVIVSFLRTTIVSTHTPINPSQLVMKAFFYCCVHKNMEIMEYYELS